MLFPPQTLLALVIISLALGANALPIPNTPLHANVANTNLVPRLEVPNEACKRTLVARDDGLIRRGCGGGGGDDGGWGDFGEDFSGGVGFGGEADFTIPDSPTPIENINIPTIEVHNHIDPPTINIPTIEIHSHLPNDPIPASITNAIDPQPIAENENKGLSWKCATHSVLGGWEAGLACSLLEEKYPPSAPAPPAPPPPKSPPPAPSPPPSPTPKPTPAPAPKKSNNGGWRGIGPPRAVPRGIRFVLG
ncbi:MAG: hypothetical protein Q9180_007738 [Flavoplaca navasiana]